MRKTNEIRSFISTRSSREVGEYFYGKCQWTISPWSRVGYENAMSAVINIYSTIFTKPGAADCFNLILELTQQRKR